MSRSIHLAAGLLLVATTLAAETNRIVLRVNDHILTLTDYQLRYNERLRAVQTSPLPEEERAEARAAIGESVFREMFDELLMLSRASHLGLEVTEQMIDDSVLQMREGSGLTDADAFEAALAKSGMSRPQLRAQARRNLVLQQVMSRELQSRVELGEEDLRRYYQSHLEDFAVARQLELRSVVVLDSSALDRAAREALATEAATVLAGQVDVESWVAKHSAASETTDLVALGWVSQGDLAAELETAVWELEEGATSAPTSSRGGLHVIQVLAVEEAHVEPFNAIRDRVERLEMSRLQRDAVAKMLADFEQASYVRIDPPPSAAGFRTTRALMEEETMGGLSAAPSGAELGSGDGS